MECALDTAFKTETHPYITTKTKQNVSTALTDLFCTGCQPQPNTPYHQYNTHQSWAPDGTSRGTRGTRAY